MAGAFQHGDGLGLRGVAAELRALGEPRIDKVGQVAPRAFYLNLRAGGANHRLLIDLRDKWARVHLTRRSFPNLAAPTSFAMLLRKHLEGSRLLRIEQPGLERVLVLVVAGRDELGDPYERRLVLELIGTYANAILLEGAEQTVVGAMRLVGEAMSRMRVVLPGRPYEAPPAFGKDFLASEEEDWTAALLGQARALPSPQARPQRLLTPLDEEEAPEPKRRKKAGAQGLAALLAKGVAGLGRPVAAQLVADAGLDPEAPVEALEGFEGLFGVLREAQRALREERFVPSLQPGPGWAYRLLPPPGQEGASPRGELSAMLEAYYGRLQDEEFLGGTRQALRSEVEGLLGKQGDRLARWGQELAQAEASERERELGELLAAHLHGIQPGSAFAEVVDFYAEGAPTIRIPLDPKLPPAANVQRHFKRFAKAKVARKKLRELLAEGEAQRAYLEGLLLAIAQAERAEDLQGIQEELDQLQGRPPAPSGPRGKRKGPEPPPPIRRYRAPEGATVWVGANNRQNDHLTYKLARPRDTWLHAQALAGAHVLVQSEGGPPSEADLKAAAAVAAYHSEARQATQVPVVVVPRRHVRKPNGGHVGSAIYDHEQVRFAVPASPEEAGLEAIG